MKKHLATVAAAALAASLAQPALAAPSTTPGATAETVTTQLPRAVRPTHYDVTITPDAEALTFTGEVAIDVDVVETTDTIVLNAVDLKISSARLTAAGGKQAMTPTITLQPDAQTATFAFDKPLTPGKYRLSTTYSGTINTQANGLFALDYVAADGSEKRALYTQFEAPDARRMIPAFDEPFYKATFTLHAVVPEDQMAVSNMPVAESAPAGEGRKRVSFRETPVMSTYLFFFGMGDFERATRQAGDAEVGVVVKRGVADQATFALDASADILPWYNAYFGTPYPLPKLDNVAAPGQSQFFGAMENWGAIFTFEYAMLLDPKLDSVDARKRIFTVLAHEMAHQWFGDLVTMSWWDDLWLNEGFASWMETRATEHFHPEWKPELGAVSTRNGAMNQDALVTTHPVIQERKTVEEASQAFDGITYSKGESVIRMLEAYTGRDEWREGVRAYMKRYEYANTVTDDLWREMEKASGKPIIQIAHDFTRQPGIPLVKVSGTCKGGKSVLALEQGEFTRDRPDKTPLSWHVPIVAAALGGAPAETLLEGSGSLEVAGCGPVIVNSGQNGYYRVAYAPQMFSAISKNFAEVPAVDQLGLLSDTGALGLAGVKPMADLLDLVQAMPADAEPEVLASGASYFSALYAYAEGKPELRGRLTKFVGAKFLPVLDRLGWTPKADEPATETELRSSLISLLGDVGEPTVVAEAKRRFAASESDPTAIDPSLRSAILGVVATHADAATWDKLHAMAKSEQSTQLRSLIYSRLGAARDPELAQKALELALTDEPGETVSPSIIRYVASEHPDLAFDFAMAHYDDVVKRVDLSAASRYFPGLAQSSLDEAMIGKLESYAAGLPEDARKPTEESIALIRYRRSVSEGRMPGVDAWLAKAGY
ncbi:aminopeptidase [Novosphingobium sp. PC22D]|uniref:M1 family metallopeptidase n=1 Tax=Novosphingobium sp. PC22D TaxID=1962403 RepID=UPI000BF0AE13|nr:M1 family metallopeptidase [Novosphingobium sp. PC22D]PEQ13208.1 aminopeptidase [Novosphingobium sp. PC22D]